MSPLLPDLLDPWRAVDKHSVFNGQLPLASCSRLRELLLDAAGEVTYRLVFSRDEEHRAVLCCEVDATLRLGCQRCLKALNQRVKVTSRLALVAGMDEERGLPERYDPLLVSERLMRPADLIEDELLLAIPQIPRHEPGLCEERVLEHSTPLRGRSPFAVLADLEIERRGEG